VGRLDEILEQLNRSAEAQREWKVLLLDRRQPAMRELLDALVEDGRVAQIHDTIELQLAELVETRAPGVEFSAEELSQRTELIRQATPIRDYGVWAYYPWSRRLVHVLPRDAYRELRADRNRLKILPEEQLRLRDFTIGVVGLSVGKATALLLAQEGIGQRFRLADFDVVNLSNLNRLQAGVETIGLNKAVLAARQMAEIDPYLEIAVFAEGVTDQNAERFLQGGGRIDLLVEECDDLFAKVWLRQRARELRIPVVMDTADRGLLDIERFDLEPERPLFHGLLGEIDPASLKGLSKKEKVPFVARIVGEQHLSERAMASLVEMDETISSFPSTASGVSLGGAIATNAIRRMLLGELRESGRYYVDLRELVRDGSAAPVCAADSVQGQAPVSLEALAAPVVRLVGARRRLDRETVRSIVEAGTLAPSAHNCQPWRFEFRSGRLACLHDIERSAGLLDFNQGAAYLALGAAVENMVQAAACMGWAVSVDRFPDPSDPRLVCWLDFAPARRHEDALAIMQRIQRRATNRRLGPRVVLDEADGAALVDAVESAGARLQLASSAQALEELGYILGKGDRLAFLCQPLHEEMMAGLRWTPEEVERTRDGIDIATMELSPSDVVGMRFLSRWKAMRVVSAMGGGRVLEKVSRKAVAAASAVGLITVAGMEPSAYFAGGRAMQRAWLEATHRDLAFQPLGMVPYLMLRVAHGGGDVFSPAEVELLGELRRRFLGVFAVPAGQAEPMLFRVARVGPPSARALRRHVEDVLVFESEA
jgi:molybdopterin/thiamine biosynthesis adenylyltransferase/nitroreductase